MYISEAFRSVASARVQSAEKVVVVVVGRRGYLYVYCMSLLRPGLTAMTVTRASKLIEAKFSPSIPPETSDGSKGKRRGV